MRIGTTTSPRSPRLGTKVDAISDDPTVIDQVNSVKRRCAIDFRGSVHDRAISLRDAVLRAASGLSRQARHLCGAVVGFMGPVRTE